MTVKNELERAIAMAAASKGSYLLFAADSEDRNATQVFADMAEDMDRHVKILESRKQYLNQHNQLNAAGSGNQTGNQSGNQGGNQGGRSGGGGQDQQKQKGQNEKSTF